MMRKNIAMALCLSVLLAGVLFSSARVIVLTGRVTRIERALPQKEAAATLPAAGPAGSRAAPPDKTRHMVLTVVDGDTIEIATASGALKVRVIGIDSPETVHPHRGVEPFGPEASKRARGLLLGKTVRIQYDPGPTHDRWGKYGRLLAYIELPDGRDFGLVMIAEGMARAYRKYRFSRMSEYVQAEQNARAAQAGIWGATNAPALGVR